MTPEGTSAIVADYARGIGRIDLKTGATAWLPLPNGKPLTGVDGLVRCGERYFGVYNGSSPGRVLSITVRAGTIEAHDIPSGSQIADPTQITFDGKRLLVVANSGWQGAGTPRGRSRGSASIMAIPLASGCNS